MSRQAVSIKYQNFPYSLVVFYLLEIRLSGDFDTAVATYCSLNRRIEYQESALTLVQISS